MRGNDEGTNVTNGHIDEAEIDALLSGDQRLVDRYLVTRRASITVRNRTKESGSSR